MYICFILWRCCVDDHQDRENFDSALCCVYANQKIRVESNSRSSQTLKKHKFSATLCKSNKMWSRLCWQFSSASMAAAGFRSFQIFSTFCSSRMNVGTWERVFLSLLFFLTAVYRSSLLLFYLKFSKCHSEIFGRSWDQISIWFIIAK